MCIIWDEGPRNGWKKGVILELIYSDDNMVRSCKVKTQHGVIERPLKLLYSLELSETDTYERSYHIDQAIYQDSVPDGINILPNEQPSCSVHENDDSLIIEQNNKKFEVIDQRQAKIDALGKIRKVIDYEKK